jgi:hypothetical protein
MTKVEQDGRNPVNVVNGVNHRTPRPAVRGHHRWPASSRPGGRSAIINWKSAELCCRYDNPRNRIPAMGKKREGLIDQVRRAASKCGMSQNALARSSGLNKGVLSRFVSGQRGLSMEALDALADVLRLNIVADGPIKLPTPLKPGPKPKRKARLNHVETS